MVQSASGASALPSFENLRPKQKEIVEAFRAGENVVVAQLPTGYGKTLAAASAFAISRALNQSNRMLVVTQRRGQAKQLAEDLPDCLAVYGIKTPTIIVGSDQVRALRAHADGSVIVFIVNIQSLIASKATWDTIQALLQIGLWFIFVDEHHHYGVGDDGEDAKWTNRIRNLNFARMLATSATANRFDRRDAFPKPTIIETYSNAAEAGYIKKLSLHAYHYTIDAVTVDGEVIRLTTEELAKQAGSETPEAIDAYMAARKMRFSPKYISPLVIFPVDRIIDKRAQGIRSQFLIQAMSCSHAKCVVDQVRALLPANLNVDWVGTGPNGQTLDDNDRIITSFCPPKDKITGRRMWTLDGIVNVGLVGEAMDSVDVSEIIFLTPAHKTITNKQTIGRASRPMLLPKDFPQIGHVNVDTTSPMADARYIGRGVELLFDEEIEPPEDDEPTEPREPPTLGEYEELPDKLGWMIADMRLLEIRSEPMFKAIFERTRMQTSEVRTDEEVSVIVERGIQDYLNRSNNASVIFAQKQDQIEAAVSKIAGLIIRRMIALNMSIERTLSGDIKKRINTQKRIAFGPVKDADEATLDRHWEWLKNLERGILLGHNLEGLPKWLR